MTQRNEPTVGTSAFDFTGMFAKKAGKTPEQLMNDALAGFTQAQANLETAQAEIAKQTAEHEAEIEKRQRLLESAKESHSRLGRVAERFKELLA
jgi:pyruvate-formate lyase